MSEEIQEKILMIEGPAQGTVLVDGKEVLISTNNSKDDIDIVDDGAHNTGVSTWDASYELSKFFIRNKDLIRNKNIMELGSGTGLVGITIGLLKPHVNKILLTDLQYTQSQIEKSIKLNNLEERAKFHVLDWNNFSTLPSLISDSSTAPNHPYPTGNNINNEDDIDFVVLADCVWLLHLVKPLVRTIKQINRPFFMAHQTRSTEVDALLFSLLEVKFDITMVEQQGKIKIYQGEMKLES